MKLNRFIGAGLFAILGIAAPAFLPTTCSAAAQEQKSWPTPEEVVAKLDSKLSLTADQKAKIAPIIADRQEKLKALAADTSSTRMQRMKQTKSIYDESDTKIKALLTDDQKTKYDAMQAEMREQMRERRQQRQTPQ